MNQRKRMVFFLLSGVLTPLLLWAAFFSQVSRNAARFLADQNGSRVYSTDVRVNGGEGKLEAYVLPHSPAEMQRQLAQNQFPETRFFVLPSSFSSGECLVLSFSSEKGAGHDAEWPQAIPRFDAVPQFSAECTKTRVAFLTAKSAASSSMAIEDAARALEGARFTEVSPPSSSCRIFSRRNEVALVFVHSQPESRETLVTVLLRSGSSKVF